MQKCLLLGYANMLESLASIEQKRLRIIASYVCAQLEEAEPFRRFEGCLAQASSDSLLVRIQCDEGADLTNILEDI